LKPKSRIRIMHRDRTCTAPLFYSGKAHGFLCAPARSGKFICVLAQMLFSWLFSCLPIDPKGQACAVTWRHRAKTLGHKVYRLDPFNVMERLPGVEECPPLARIDPMARLDPRGMTYGADADNIAEALVPHDAQGESFWINSARALVAGVIMQIKKWWPDENLVTVYHTIAGTNLSLFARDAILLAHALRGHAHAHIELRHIVDNPRIRSELIPAHGDHAHGLHTAGEDDIGVA